MSAMFKLLGAVLLAVLVMVGALAAVYVPKGFALERSAVAYMETNVPLIVANWDSSEVTKRAAPEFLVPAVQEGLPTLFAQLSKLGKLKSLGKPEGGVVVADLQLAIAKNQLHLRSRDQRLQPISAELVADAVFDAGPARVKMTLVRRGSDWRIIGFWVGPPTASNEG